LKLWSSFPSSANLDDAKTDGALTEWLETVEQFTAEAVDEACKRLKRRNVAFLPSAGQIFTECQNAAADIRQAEIRANATPRVEYQYPPEHRERMKARFNALVEELKSGANFNPNYGERPKGTKPEKPIVERRVPGTFMEKWERENGRPYPHKAQVEALLTDPKSKLYDANFKGFNS